MQLCTLDTSCPMSINPSKGYVDQAEQTATGNYLSVKTDAGL